MASKMSLILPEDYIKYGSTMDLIMVCCRPDLISIKSCDSICRHLATLSHGSPGPRRLDINLQHSPVHEIFSTYWWKHKQLKCLTFSFRRQGIGYFPLRRLTRSRKVSKPRHCMTTLNTNNVVSIVYWILLYDILHNTGPLFTKKIPSYWYRNSHYKPETVVGSSWVYNVDSFTHKTVSF